MSDLVTVIPYVVASIVKEGKILLVFRKNTSYGNDQYAMPGGKVERNESPLQAVLREAYEEVGIIANQSDTRFGHTMYFMGEQSECVVFAFIIQAWTGEASNKEPAVHDHIAWFDINALPSAILSRHKKMIESIKRGVFYSDEGF